MKNEDDKSNDAAQKSKFSSDFYSSAFLKINQVDQNRTFAKKTYNNVNISETKIFEMLSKIETSKACGPHNIGNIVLKTCLTVFKAALLKGYIPSFWKKSEIFPVFEDEDRADVKQYRPVSLLCSTSKVFEKINFKKLYDILKTTLHNAQHVFEDTGRW